jgi:predicted NBD/HSP70 family sugar kinase
MEIESLSSSELSVVDRKKQQYLRSILCRAYFTNTFTISSIAKHIHISIPSITSYINELIDVGWLVETAAKATASGRRPSIFKLNPAKKNFIIVDINTRTTTVYLVDLSHDIRAKREIQLAISEPAYQNLLLEQVEKLVNEFGSPWAIGLSSPGLIHKKKEENLTYTNHNANGMSLTQWLGEQTGIKSYLINDTRASLLGEYHFGYVKKKENVILLNMDWGVGLGILANGSIVEGSDGFSGELGHIQVKPDGKLCHCGKIGCLDTIASASSILANVVEGLNNGEKSLLQEKKEEITIDHIIWAVKRGDSFAISVVNNAANELGKGLAVVIHLLNPQTIIIDGILSSMGDLITSAIQQAINKYCINDFKQGLDIVVSPFGDLSKVYGTASYVFDKMISR